MTKYIAIPALFVAILFAACTSKEREDNLKSREQDLLEKEKQFAMKEADYQALLKLRDSLLFTIKDTPVLLILPETIAGQWSSKVVCIESACPDYVVGDQRTDIWEFGSDSDQVIVKNINNNNLIRVYTGSYDGAEIKLGFKTDSAAAKQVEMQVLLNDIKENKIRGTRSVTVDNKCNAKFSVDLDRVKTKGL